jgi:uncharacterized protein YigE (DUF2233 family)
MVCLLPETVVAEPIVWEPLTGGLAVSVWKPGETCPGVPAMLVADINPELTRFFVHYYAQEGLSQPPTILEWQRRTRHHMLFNAGLFREDFSYLGLLYQDGRSVGSRRHPSWQGLFVAEPALSGQKRARVLDLASETFDEQQPSYREAAQSLMLLDHNGKIRVRLTGKQAFQTIVAEAHNGHIFVFKSLDPVTLYDIGLCLKETVPAVRRAMAMDGGSSSDVLVAESLWQDTRLPESRAAWKSWFSGNVATHVPLPAVIGVSPR